MAKPEIRIIGQHKRDLNVVQYRSGWKEKYQLEEALLRKTLAEEALQIEHVGSTSIPGIHAKPIIDMMVAVISLKRALKLIPLLEGIGYIYRPDDTIPERIYFVREYKPEHRTHHLNLVERESSFWKNQLLFRDYLLENKKKADEYVALKKRLAEEYEKTQILDREGKTSFVMGVLELAKKEKMASI